MGIAINKKYKDEHRKSFLKNVMMILHQVPFYLKHYQL